jgi:hypothetical protein
MYAICGDIIATARCWDIRANTVKSLNPSDHSA